MEGPKEVEPSTSFKPASPRHDGQQNILQANHHKPAAAAHAHAQQQNTATATATATAPTNQNNNSNTNNSYNTQPGQPAFPQVDAMSSIPAAFFARVAASPDADAYLVPDTVQGERRENHIIWKRKSWTRYGRSVTRIARGLLALGVQPGETVCLFGKTRPKWAGFFLAALAIGAVPTAVASASKKQEIGHIITHSEAVVVVLEKQSQLKKLRSSVKSMSSIRHIIIKDSGDHEKCVPWKSFLRKGDAGGNALDVEIAKRTAALNSGSLASLIYSPGTEDKTNAVMLSHRNILWTAGQMQSLLGINDTDVYMSFLSMSHATEQVMAIVLPILSGMQVYYAPDITYLLVNVRDVQPTVVAAPPEFWSSFYVALKANLPSTGVSGLSEQIVDQVKKTIGCGRIRRAVIGGNSQSCPLDMYDFYKSLNVTLIHSYGLLETTGVATMDLTYATHSTQRFDCVGTHLPECEVQIGSEGQIRIKGPNVFLGYYKDPAQSEAVLKDGWLETGDLGEMDTHGNLIYKGRKSEIIRLTDGQTLMPLRLETSLRSIPLIKYAIMVGAEKEHVGVLLILDLNAVKRVARRKACSPKRLFASTDFQMQLKQHVDSIAKAEKVKVRRFSIVPRPLSVKKGELTSTMSVRRRVLYSHFANEIDSLYKEGLKSEKEGLLVADDGRKEGPKDAETAKRESGGINASSGDTGKKMTDGHFYRKTAAGEFKRTELKQSEVEEMEKQLMTAMKEIRDLAKTIKMLQEQHELDADVLNRHSSDSLNGDNHGSNEDVDSDDGRRKKKSGGTLKKSSDASGKSTVSSAKKVDPKADKKATTRGGTTKKT